ncbi:nucleolar protein NOP5, putative [Eimeria brunetti]|uniref:Nucleolar protein NOP5, putative n=1 Tax=Eimeria brunetti TaxID=51314 RepID=U6LIG1_9EIME|nr:nucleolar protein NOP5, putative [Eimeria brunetti]
MLALLETAAGFALFRIKDGSLVHAAEVEDIFSAFSSEGGVRQYVELASFSRFKDTKQAAEEIKALHESRMGKGLQKFLKKNILQAPAAAEAATAAAAAAATLIVSDKGLAAAVKRQLNIDVIFSPQTHEILRGIKQHISSLITGLDDKDRHQMAMSLSHALNRFKLRFSPEKLDTMIIQAVGLLEDLDRELNGFAMRLKEWYGWHFPELAKIVGDNGVYAQLVLLLQFRQQAKQAPLENLLPDEICAEIRLSAETSMGTDMTEDDLAHISALATRVIELTEYRTNLAEYLKLRMRAVAPNLTHMVGEVLGARLLAHCGSLLSLSKQPASTLQILGAEKALFRALKTKGNTPKYGILYHAALVGQASPKLKGKISRVLAAKLSLCVRVDALTEAAEAAAAAAGAAEDPAAAAAAAAGPAEPTVAVACRRYVENRLEQLEQQLAGSGPRPASKPAFQRYTPHRDINGAATKYDTSTDAVDTPQVHKKQKRQQAAAAAAEPAAAAASSNTEETEQPKKKKKIKTEIQA